MEELERPKKKIPLRKNIQIKKDKGGNIYYALPLRKAYFLEVGERYPKNLTDANVQIVSSPLGPVVIAFLKPFNPVGDLLVFIEDQVVSLYPRARRPFRHLYSMFMVSSIGFEKTEGDNGEIIYTGTAPTDEKFQVCLDLKNNMMKFVIPAEGEDQIIRQEEHENGKAFIVHGLAVACTISEIKEENFFGKKYKLFRGPCLDVYIRMEEEKENPITSL